MKLAKLKALVKKIDFGKLNEWEEEFLESLETNAEKLEADGKELFMSDKRADAVKKILRKQGLLQDGVEEPKQHSGKWKGSPGRKETSLSDDALGLDKFEDEDVPF